MHESAWGIHQQPLWQHLTITNAQERPDLIPQDTLVIPFFVSITICALRSLYLALRWMKQQSPNQFQESIVRPNATFSQRILAETEKQGGLTLWRFAIARFTGCLSLFVLSTITLWEISRTKAPLPLLKCPESYMALTYLYCSILAFFSLISSKRSSFARKATTFIMLAVIVTYAYRDLWPLATYTENPKDVSEGAMLWAKMTILFATAILIPLFVPTCYAPVDPKNPSPVPNPEQTSSIFSFVTYSYVNPVISLGYRAEHIEVEHLPPLCDTDASSRITKEAFPYLDTTNGAQPRHLFFRLMRVFWKEYILMFSSFFMVTLATFLPPICIYHILNYMENAGVGDNLRPWFWILCLLLGPAISSLLSQYYLFIGSKVTTHIEALLTQLVFEHSLRIRFTTKGANDEAPPPEQESMTPVTPDDNASVAEDAAANELNSTSDTERGSGSEADTGSQSMAHGSKKGKDKDDSLPDLQKTLPPSKPSKGDNLTGKINNLITSDLGNITFAASVTLVMSLNQPLKIALCALFLYRMLGWSSLVGLGLMTVLLPVPGYAAKLIQDVEIRKMDMTDARIQVVTEVMNVLRMVKLFGWEEKMSQRIKETREKELLAIWWLKVLESLTGTVDTIIPTINMLTTYVVYTAFMKQELTPSVIFSSLTVFDTLRRELYNISWYISRTMQAKVSLDRINDFLKNTELIDSFTTQEPENNIGNPPSYNADLIGFKNATFSWYSAAATELSTPSHRFDQLYKLRVDGELFFKPGCINLIIGPTGSGKTSILMALLGEMHFTRDGLDSWYNLPREGGVAYGAQESWVQNETIRSNILFGSPFDESRYHKVLDQCSLNQDLSLFEAGDKTEVGEKGITLSGGQKARLTLARAIYSPAKIVLLDDVFAALDVHTSIAIVERCFKGDLMKGRTILLVTHNIALVSPIAGYIVSIGQDGKITSQSSDIQTALDSDIQLANEARVDYEEQEIANQEIPSLVKEEGPQRGKLVLAEEIAKGHVTWKSISLFLSGLGGSHPIFFFVLWILALFSEMIIATLQKWFLGYWGSQYENHTPSEVSVSYYSTIYASITLFSVLVSNLSWLFYVSGTMRASRTINTQLVESVLHSTLRWLDETPTARIIARFTQDIQMVDGPIAQSFVTITALSLDIITNLGVVFFFAPLFIMPGLVLGVLAITLGNIYLKAQLSVTREKSNARSPVLAHFGSAVAGIVSIRAYGAQESFKAESLVRIDKYVRITRVAYNLNRWIAVRIDILGQAFFSALACYLVYGKSIGASNTGFSLNVAAELFSMLLVVVRFFNDFEVQSNSLERIQSYLDIDHEPTSIESGRPPAAWPTSGDLRVEKLSARYSKNGPTILHDLSFHVESGQRVGIVGRTGSGKSSLTLALLRCIITEGTVYFDSLPTNKINLDALRSAITIIPQTPELISGTLRQNLDPFGQHDDATLNEALRSVGLFSLQEEVGEARINLDSKITSSGSNLSVGERQILALARAIVRGSKLLILDEATSAIDYKTDAVIQTTLRHKLDPSVTVITVAHRLQTVMDADKIMVLDGGRIAEFDTPQTLLSKENSLFKALVDGSGDRTVLYNMAERK